MPNQTLALEAPKYPLKRAKIALSCMALGFLSACANVIPPCGAKVSPPSSELRNTKWELTRWNLPPNSYGEVRTRQIPLGEASNPIQIITKSEGGSYDPFSNITTVAAKLPGFGVAYTGADATNNRSYKIITASTV